jgi:predicted TIM-barrel fold metal-dependent hydrolase
MGFSPAGVKQCIELFGVKRVLFGTDYAAVPISPQEHIDIIKGLGLSQEDEARIFWKNANALFHLLY